MLLSYSYMLKRENSETVTKFQIDEENKFEFCFMALGPYIFGFKMCFIPAITSDRTNLKGKYKRILFIAIAMDNNDRIFPIAFGVRDIENDRA